MSTDTLCPLTSDLSGPQRRCAPRRVRRAPPHRDVDIQARAISADRKDVQMVRDIAAETVDDGFAFDTSTATAETIRDRTSTAASASP
jgi:hypothetical protein